MKLRSFTSNSKGHSDLRRFAVKMLLLGGITLLAQLAIYPYQQKLEAENHQRSLEKIRYKNRIALRELVGEIGFGLSSLSMEDLDTKNERQLEFLLIGDSSIMYIKKHDDGDIVETTWQLLERKLPGCTILSVSSRALNFVMFDLIVQYLHEKTDYINTIILPMNVRSFGASWFYSHRPEFDSMRTALIMGRMNLEAFEKPAQIVKLFQSQKRSPEYLARKRQKELDEMARREQVEYGAKGISSLGLGGNRIVYNFEIDPAHPLLRALDSLVSHCRDSNTRLILYATPIDLDYIGKYHGEFTAETTRKNLAFLKNYCEKTGVEMLDFTDALPLEEMLPIQSTAGHLRGIGRAHLAQLIVDELRSRGISNCAITTDRSSEGVVF